VINRTRTILKSLLATKQLNILKRTMLHPQLHASLRSSKVGDRIPPGLSRACLTLNCTWSCLLWRLPDGENSTWAGNCIQGQ
jgi:hypothetical protein